jgi:hypothetical protein
VRWLATKVDHDYHLRVAIEEDPSDFVLLGLSLSALHQIAICHPSCTGGPHVYQAIVGRLYNNAAAAFRLISFGFYDESLSLIRNMGETSNLLILFLNSPDSYIDWCLIDAKRRWANYRPKKVRAKLESLRIPVPMEDDVYSNLSEKATHITPETRPNLHSEGKNTVGIIGGLFQLNGMNHALGLLTEASTAAALVVARGFGRDELFSAISEGIKGVSKNTSSGNS